MSYHFTCPTCLNKILLGSRVCTHCRSEVAYGATALETKQYGVAFAIAGDLIIYGLQEGTVQDYTVFALVSLGLYVIGSLTALRMFRNKIRVFD